MKKYYLLLIGLLISCFIFSQSSELDIKNGFKNIKLGDNVNKYAYLVKTDYFSDDYKLNICGKAHTFNSNKTHVVNLRKYPVLNYIGEFKVLGIYVGTIDNLIFEIQVITEYNYELYENLISIFGEPSFISQGNHKDSVTFWDTGNTFLSISANFVTQQRPCHYTLTYSNNQLKDVYVNKVEEINKKKRELELQGFKNDL